MLIRNDDVAADTTLREIQTFCEICDRYGVGIIQCVTPLGAIRPIRPEMSNTEIMLAAGGGTFFHNAPVVQYLRSRNDAIAVHGLWHTHAPTLIDVAVAEQILAAFGFEPKYFVPPFNEGRYPATFGGLKTVQYVPRLEEFLDAGDPGAEIVYLHSWRFREECGPFTWQQLDSCLRRLTQR